jgi:outer membrane receptor protein involved in Fe transport
MPARELAACASRIVAVLLSALCLVLFCGERSAAQQATALLTGTIKDSTGAVVPGAKVTLKNSDTNIARTETSNKDGDFLFTLVPIGPYQVEVTSEGFRRYVHKGITLEINQNARLDVALVVGASTQVVEVLGNVTQVDTVSDTIGTSVIGETIQRAPLNGRDVLDLALLQPGVTETNGDSTAAGKYSVAGGRSDSVTFLLDGGLNNNLLDNSVVFNPNPDTIAEFRILESNYSAEYGRNGGGVISVVTKSGTNQWHGSGFEFLRNDAFNANSFFNKAAQPEIPRDVLKRNQYGFTLGGPITLPKLLNGKDRFFFFVGYQGQRLSAQQSTGPGTVFTPSQLNGDFSQSAGQNGLNPNGPDPGVACFLSGLNENSAAIDPNTGQPYADGTSCGATAQTYFQSNSALAAQAIIDPTKINPTATEYVKLGLIPTNPNGFQNFQGAHKDNNNELTMKFDFLISDKDKVSATLGGFRNPQLNPFQFASVPGTPNTTQNNNYYANVAYTHTFSPTVLNEFRLFLQRSNYFKDKPGVKLPTASQLNIGINQDDPQGPPNLWFDNNFYVGFSEQGPTDEVDTTFGFSDTLTYVHGRHNWKLGAGISAYRDNTVYDYYVNGEFDFFAYGAGTDNSLADFVLGIPSQYFQYPHAPSNIRSKSYYGFVQDEWRVTKRLTLDLGIRYEYSSPKKDTKGRSYSLIPGQQSTVFTGAPTGMVFPGDAGAPEGVNFPVRTNWAPRLGFAWDPRGDAKTSIRGGFGMFYDILKGEDNLQFNGQPPFFSSAGLNFPTFSGNGPSPYFTDPFDNAIGPNGTIGVPDPFPSHPPSPNLDFNAAGFLPINAAGSAYFVDPHLKTPITYQYNLSIQHELAPNTALEVSYVGNISHGMTSLIDVNPFVLGTTDRILNLGTGDSTCQDASGNPTVNPPPGPCSFGNAPEFKNVSNASYNSLQASLNRQLVDSHYLGRTYFTLAYTYAHSIDNVSGFRQRNSQIPSYQPNLFRASSDQDIRQRITFSGGWDLPFDRLSGPKRLTHGWSLFPIVTWHTGQPFDVFANLGEQYTYNAEGPSGAGDPTNIHANIVGPLNTLNPRTTQTINGTPGQYYFNPNSLSNAQCGDPTCVPGPGVFPADSQVQADPTLATYGTLPRNFFRGPSYINFDLAFSKTTAITERVKLEFRAEFFNIFNHANFMNPGLINYGNGTFSGGAGGTNPNSGLFGQITSTFDPRIIQLAGRFSF